MQQASDSQTSFCTANGTFAGECVGRNVNAVTPNVVQHDEQNTEHLPLCMANYGCSYTGPHMLGCCGLAADNIGHLILAGTKGLKVNHSCT